MKYPAVIGMVLVILVSLNANAGELNKQAVKRGEYLFKGACGAYCHSLTPELRDAPFLFDCSWIHGGSDDAIFKVIFSGVPDTRMPGFANMLPNGEDDIWQIVAYLKANRQHC